jgi:ABC-2 type transport system permease protein
MNIFLHELKSYRRSTLIWAISLSVLTIVFLLMYPAFTQDVVASKKVLTNLPPALRDALGISLSNFFTIFGFYSYLLTFLVLAATIQAMNLGLGIISKEDSGKTADFLLTKPVSRTAIITSKLCAATSLLVMTNVIFISVSILAARAVSKNTFAIKTFILISLTVLLVQIAFLALGFVFSVTIPKIKSVISVTLPTVFVFFIIGALGSILGNENVRYITPFKFYDTNYIISNSALEVKFVIIEAVFVVVAITISYVVFIHKDIRAAV